MPRTVAALYNSRVEAERASLRLMSHLKARPGRIIGKDTVAALDDLKISKEDADLYRDEVRRGAHLLVAQVSSRSSPERVIELLEEAAVPGFEPDRQEPDSEQGVKVAMSEETLEQPEPAASEKPHESAAERADFGSRGGSKPGRREPVAKPSGPIPSEVDRKELRVGQPHLAGGGARVRSFTHDVPAEQEVSLRDVVIEVESRACERNLTDAEVEAGGLFKDRVFEAVEMREEPVVTKVTVLREEVIVRKAVRARTETIRETVRQTEVQVEDLPASEAAALFGNRATGDEPEVNEPEPGGDKTGAHSSGWF